MSTVLSVRELLRPRRRDLPGSVDTADTTALRVRSPPSFSGNGRSPDLFSHDGRPYLLGRDLPGSNRLNMRRGDAVKNQIRTTTLYYAGLGLSGARSNLVDDRGLRWWRGAHHAIGSHHLEPRGYPGRCDLYAERASWNGSPGQRPVHRYGRRPPRGPGSGFGHLHPPGGHYVWVYCCHTLTRCHRYRHHLGHRDLLGVCPLRRRHWPYPTGNAGGRGGAHVQYPNDHFDSPGWRAGEPAWRPRSSVRRVSETVSSAPNLRFWPPGVHRLGVGSCQAVLGFGVEY